MNRIEKLEAKVRELYEAKYPDRADWADWLYENHIFIVADFAVELAKRFGGNVEYSQASAMLHDIADSKMKRFDSGHETESLKIAKSLLKESEYNEEEIKLIVDDAIKYHSCHGGITPKSVEGRVLATADALAHLKTNFYEYFSTSLLREKTPDEVNQSTLSKLDRDFNNKIIFNEVKDEAERDYRRLKALYS